ncbi:unnamed protein product [Allacma fusca]|uniref:Uncharacterized protein n=1 Tax=Allacma fusca TaxID=39272 RepID=A0A8J2LEW6_9HEXA|nr:unnamed protein product [Allacma fusca]
MEEEDDVVPDGDRSDPEVPTKTEEKNIFEVKVLTSNAKTSETQTAKKFEKVLDYLTTEKLSSDPDADAGLSDLFPDWTHDPSKRKETPGSSRNKNNKAKNANNFNNMYKVRKAGLPREAIITPKNANTTQWGTEFSILSISRCCNILPIENVCRETVTTITFSNYTMFQNVLTFVQKCPNLKELSFINIKLNPRNRIGSSNHNIYCNNLTSLSFCCSQQPLSSQEYSLLDFFHRSVSCPQLKSFAFSGVDMLPPKSEVSEASPNPLQTTLSSPSLESVEPKVEVKPINALPKFDPSLVGLFLIKNHPSLKFISCGGSGCRIFDRGMDTDHSEMIKTVQIDSIKFGVTTKGMEYILQAQNSLKSLTCCGFTSEISPKFNRTICSCIDKNFRTLHSVAIFPCIISNNLVNGTYEDIYALNCQVFEGCFALQKLYISVNYAESEKAAQHPCGTILNMNLLPVNLVHVEIYTSEFHQKELQMFAECFPNLQKLKRLALSSSSKNLYTVEPSWLQALLALPKILTLDFLGGHVTNTAWFQKYMELNHEDIIVTTDDTMISLYKRSYLPN